MNLYISALALPGVFSLINIIQNYDEKELQYESLFKTKKYKSVDIIFIKYCL